MSKERRYDSKLSREMLKGSCSLKAVRDGTVLLEVVEREEVVQKERRSCGGEGGR